MKFPVRVVCDKNGKQTENIRFVFYQEGIKMAAKKAASKTTAKTTVQTSGKTAEEKTTARAAETVIVKETAETQTNGKIPRCLWIRKISTIKYSHYLKPPTESMQSL